MKGIMDYILERRSVRKYEDKEIDKKDLILLLQAAMSAPTACNSQPWEFIVVDDRERMNELRSNLFFGPYNAPAAIVVCSNLKLANNSASKNFWVQDLSAATENILLAASGLGFGAVWIGVYPHPSVMKPVAQVLSIPEDVIPFSVVYIGYPAEQKEPRTNYDERRVYWQEYEPRKRRAKTKNAKFL